MKSKIGIYFKQRVNRNSISAKITTGDGQNFEVTTKISTPSDSDLRIEKGNLLVGDHPDLDDLNYKLFEFKKRIRDLARDLEGFYGSITTSMLKETVLKNKVPKYTLAAILESEKAILESGNVTHRKTGKPLSFYSIRAKLIAVKKLHAIAKDLPEFDFTKYNMAQVGSVTKKLIMDRYKELNKKIIDKLYKDGVTDRTISNYMNTLKNVLRTSLEDTDFYIEPFLDIFTYSRDESEVIVLSSEQYQFVIENYDKIYNECSRVEKDVFEAWYAALMTCARIGDIVQWTASNLVEKDGLVWLSYKTSKGKRDVSIPVEERLHKIFMKNAERADGKLILAPRDSSRALKRIAKRYEVFQTKITKTVGKKGSYEAKEVFFWEVMHMHMMRGSGMTAMRRAGAPDHVIKKFSSHTENSAAYRRYMDTEKKEIIDHAVSFFNGVASSGN